MPGDAAMPRGREALRLAILDDYQGVALSLADWASLAPRVEIEAIGEPLGGPEAVVRRLRPFHILVAMRERTRFPAVVLGGLPRLRLLVTTGKRNAAIDMAAAAAQGITVCGTQMLEHPTAELTWGLILALARRIPQQREVLRAGGWQDSLGVDLRGATLGILGLGRLGSQVATIGRAFGMQVIAWSPNLQSERATALGVEPVDRMALFGRSDIVSLHMVLAPSTRGLVGPAEIAAMKPTAFLINTARGPLVDEAALLDALVQRRIGGAGLDVFDQEPLPADHPFRTLDNVVATPHLGYVTRENYRLAYGQAVENVRSFLDGAPQRVIPA